MPDTTTQPLFDAVGRGAALVLSLPTREGLRHCKSRFLGEDQHGVWVSAAGEEALVDRLIEGKRPVGISFRAGDVRHVFVSPVLRKELYFEARDGTTTAALLLAFPTDVKAMQRRSSYRVRIPPETDLAVRCWRMTRRADLHDKPIPSQEVATEVRDISLGGLGVTFHGTATAPPQVTPDDRLRIEIRYRDFELLIEGRMRPVPQPLQSTSLRTGIRFRFLQEGIEDRQTLTRLTKILGDLQREEARYQRMLAKQQTDAA